MQGRGLCSTRFLTPGYQDSLEKGIKKGRLKIRLLVSIIVIITIAMAISVYYCIDRVDLSSEERGNIADACSQCHRNPEHLDHNVSKVHSIHTSADCMTCHAGADGLETADNAHDIMVWAGIGIAGATVAGLGANYIVARKRVGKIDGRKNG